MFDIGWSELLLIAVLALIVVGPKELPGLLRTVGRYVGMIRSQASQFRAQIEDAIKDTEIDDLKNEMTGLRDDISSTLNETSDAFNRDMNETKSTLNDLGRDKEKTQAAQKEDNE